MVLDPALELTATRPKCHVPGSRDMDLMSDDNEFSTLLAESKLVIALSCNFKLGSFGSWHLLAKSLEDMGMLVSRD